jgi:hypothetical protein
MTTPKAAADSRPTKAPERHVGKHAAPASGVSWDGLGELHSMAARVRSECRRRKLSEVP